MGKNLPGLGDHDVEKRLMPVAKAGETNANDHIDDMCSELTDKEEWREESNGVVFLCWDPQQDRLRGSSSETGEYILPGHPYVV